MSMTYLGTYRLDFWMRAGENVEEVPPLFHATEENVELFVEVERMEVDFIIAHQFVRGSGGGIAILYETRIRVTGSFWEGETDLRRFPWAILRYRTGTPNQRGGTGNGPYSEPATKRRG